MSLGIAIKAPVGIVLAAESRVTLTAQIPQGMIPVNFDNASKLFAYDGRFGFVTYGQAAIGIRTVQSFLPEFESQYADKAVETVADYAKALSKFFFDLWKQEMSDDYRGAPMSFVVGGYNKGEPYGRVYLFEIPSKPEVIEQSPEGFGYTWGGQREFVDRVLLGFDPSVPGIIRNTLGKEEPQAEQLIENLKKLQMPIPLEAMPLQDCINLAIFFVRTTITAQSLSVGVRGCGGYIDVATITRDKGLRFIQRKAILGEDGSIANDFERD